MAMSIFRQMDKESALRTATTKQFGDEYDLDKKQSDSNIVLDENL